MTIKSLVGLGAVGLALAALGAGCGDDDDANSGDSTAATLSAEVSLSGDRVKLEAPASVEAGVTTMRLTNSAPAPIGVEIIRVDGEQTADEVLTQITREEGPIPGWIHGAGGAGVAPPDGEAAGTQILEPGTHYLIAEGSGDDAGPATAAKLEVTGSGQEDAELPEADARIVADEYSFETADLEAGSNTIKFENVGRELHHALAFPIQGDTPIAEVQQFFQGQGQQQGPPPIDFEGGFGTPVLDGGTAQTIELEIEPGRYALVCFIPNRAGSPPHAALGMVNEIEIK